MDGEAKVCCRLFSGMDEDSSGEASDSKVGEASDEAREDEVGTRSGRSIRSIRGP